MTVEELIESLRIVKKQIEDTVGNRHAGQNYTIIGSVGPDSFTFILDEVIKVLDQESDLDKERKKDVMPIIHAKWEDDGCSNCHCDIPAYIIDWMWQKDMDAKFCPQCGAKMDLGGGIK